MADCPASSTLEDLELPEFQISDVGLTSLAASSKVQSLRSLKLMFNVIADGGVAAISRSAVGAKLKEFSASQNAGSGQLTADSARALAGLALGSLDLRGNSIRDKGAEALASSLMFVLEELDLSECGVGASGAAAISKAQFMKSLRKLDLSHGKIGDQGCIAIASAPWPALESLHLADVGMTPAGLDALITKDWQSLRSLRAGYNDSIDKLAKERLESFTKKLASI